MNELRIETMGLTVRDNRGEWFGGRKRGAKLRKIPDSE